MKKNNHNGLTLVEVIIAVALMGIIAIGMLPMFSYSFTTVYRMGHRTEAVAIAQDVIDSLYESATPGTDDSTPVDVGTGSYSYQRSFTADPAPNLRKVSVTVFKNDKEIATIHSLVP